MHLLGRAFLELPGLMKGVYSRYFREIHVKFVEAIAEAVPELPIEEVQRRYHFAFSLVMVSMSQRNRMRQLSSAYCDPDDIEGTVERLIDFICSGFRSASMHAGYGKARGKVG